MKPPKNRKIHSEKVYNKAMRYKHLIKTKSVTITTISRKLGIPRNTLSAWYHGRQPFFKFIKSNQEKAVKVIPETAKILSPEKAYILGVICGDGYINYHRGYISLETISIEFIEKFRESLMNVYGSLYAGHVAPTCNRKQRFVVCGKNMTDDIKKYLGKDTGSFCWKVPEQIMNSKTENKINFIKGFFDSEGNVDLKYALVLHSANFDALKQVKGLIEDLDIKTSTIRPNKMAYRIYITGRGNMTRFIKLIGTNIENKHNKMRILLDKYKTRLSSVV